MNHIFETRDNINIHDFHHLKCINDNIPYQLNYPSIAFNYNKQNDNITEKISKIIHFIWIGKIIPENYINTCIECKKINVNYKIILWVDYTSMNESIKNHLLQNNIEVMNIYDFLQKENEEIEIIPLNNYIIELLNKGNNYGYKADIIRLYVVYYFGGIYSDIDSVWIKPFDDNFDNDFVTYRIDKQCSNLTNSFFGFQKKSWILCNIINNLHLSIDCFLKINNESIFNRYIPLITGPDFFSYMIANFDPKELKYIHQAFCVIGGPHEEFYSNYFYENKCFCYQTFDKNWC